MEFRLKNRHGAFPVEVTIDEDNYRFTVRNVDTTGAFFNSACDLIDWVKNNWMKEDFENPEEFDQMLLKFEQYCPL
jgi:hypothetical protein